MCRVVTQKMSLPKLSIKINLKKQQPKYLCASLPLPLQVLCAACLVAASVSRFPEFLVEEHPASLEHLARPARHSQPSASLLLHRRRPARPTAFLRLPAVPRRQAAAGRRVELVSHPNGAVVPQDEPAVAAARAQHLALHGRATDLHLGLAGGTVRLVTHPNGAVVPADEPAVVAARAEHSTGCSRDSLYL